MTRPGLGGHLGGGSRPGSGSILHRVVIVGEGDADRLVDQVGEVGLCIAAVGDMSGIQPCLIDGEVDGDLLFCHIGFRACPR